RRARCTATQENVMRTTLLGLTQLISGHRLIGGYRLITDSRLIGGYRQGLIVPGSSCPTAWQQFEERGTIPLRKYHPFSSEHEQADRKATDKPTDMRPVCSHPASVRRAVNVESKPHQNDEPGRQGDVSQAEHDPIKQRHAIHRTNREDETDDAV